jgi:hypothetical protein
MKFTPGGHGHEVHRALQVDAGGSAPGERPLGQLQGCQIFRGTTYPNGKNVPKLYQTAIKYTKWP